MTRHDSPVKRLARKIQADTGVPYSVARRQALELLEHDEHDTAAPHAAPPAGASAENRPEDGAWPSS